MSLYLSFFKRDFHSKIVAVKSEDNTQYWKAFKKIEKEMNLHNASLRLLVQPQHIGSEEQQQRHE